MQPANRGHNIYDEKYPMSALARDKQSDNLLLSSFLDFLEAKFRFINRDLEEKFIPVEYNSYFDRNKLLAEFHGIDLAQMDREQREMMEELMRSQQHI